MPSPPRAPGPHGACLVVGVRGVALGGAAGPGGFSAAGSLGLLLPRRQSISSWEHGEAGQREGAGQTDGAAGPTFLVGPFQ